MSRVPALSRRTLAELVPGGIAASSGEPSAVRRAFGELIALLAVRDAALAEADRLAVADTPGLKKAEARADARTDRSAEAAATLLIAPVRTRADIALKLAVLIAACEPHSDEARTFPAVYLRVLLADLQQFEPVNDGSC